MLGSFFKAPVYFKFFNGMAKSNQTGWSTIEIYSNQPTWLILLRETFGEILSDQLFFDDYILSQDKSYFIQVQLHAPIDMVIDYLISRHGFIQVTQDKDPVINKWVTHFVENEQDARYAKQINMQVLGKRFTSKQFDDFVKDLHNLKLSPEIKDMLESFKNLKSFNDFSS